MNLEFIIILLWHTLQHSLMKERKHVFIQVLHQERTYTLKCLDHSVLMLPVHPTMGSWERKIRGNLHLRDEVLSTLL